MSEDDTAETAPQAPATHTSPPAASRTRPIVAAAVIAAITGIGGYLIGTNTAETTATPATTTTIASTTSSVPKETSIEAAATACHVTSNVTDNGETIIFDTEGTEEFSGDSYSDVACVLNELGTPGRVISAMDSTRALDGTLEDGWDIYRARWNYHPDSGMNLTVWIDQ